MKYLTELTSTFILLQLFGCAASTAENGQPAAELPYKVVFVTGDEEYRSEESMPMLARIIKREMGAEVEVLYALDSAGFIDPNRSDHIAGLEALETADLMVLFTRFRNLPPEEQRYITDFAESGKPMVGFRTSTHAFLYREDSSRLYLNNEWPTKVFGQQWITHHGHFEDGNLLLTRITKAEGQADHPILRGVDTARVYSWLYHVDGGDWALYGDSQPLLLGHALRSKHEMEGRLAQFALTQPVAWTKTYTGSEAKAPARVFFTTLGHPYDFRLKSIRKLALNGIFWAAGKSSMIPPAGVNATLAAPYEPNNSGFGRQFKPNLRPAEL